MQRVYTKDDLNPPTCVIEPWMGDISTNGPQIASCHQTSPSTSLLCALCKVIIDQWTIFLSDEHHQVPHYGSVSEVQESATKGCALCTQFARAIQIQSSRDGQSTSHLEKATSKTWPLSNGGSTVLHKQMGPKGHVVMSPPGTGFGYIEKTHRLTLMIPSLRRPFAPYTVSMVEHFSSHREGADDSSASHLNTRDSLGLCLSWLQECLHAHRLCLGPPSDFVPTRLISVKSDIRLVPLEGLHNIEYATLSHRWGDTGFLTLTNANFERFCHQIPPEALSKTFQDAIVVCKYLGIEYIWIDSLAIIQDDPEDWKREAALMTQVYKHSHLNIAARSASNGTFGLFFDREPGWQCRVEVSASGTKQIFDCVPFWMYKGSLNYEPLSTRGWALQESLLPPRTLHFTRTQIFWTCADAINCETFPDGLPSSISGTSSHEGGHLIRKRPIHEYDWRDIVVSYTSRLLTFPKDKLVAISGLAREIQSYSKDSYCAGLWLKDLHILLCWFNQGHRESSSLSLTPPRTAPSWSWASVPGPVTFRMKVAFFFVRGLRFEYPSDEDPFGMISTARVILSCYNMWKGTFEDDRGAKNTVPTANRHGKLLLAGSEFKSVRLCLNDDAELDFSSLWFLPVVVHDMSAPNSSKPRLHMLLGLILRGVEGRTGSYHRIGVFQRSNIFAANSEDCRSMLQEEMLDSPVGRAGDEMYGSIYTDENGDLRKVITLV